MSDAKYNLDSGRSEAQREHMKDLLRRGVCVFCRENIEAEQKQPIEHETEHWVVKNNEYPYERTTHHLLLIPKEHVHTISELSEACRSELGSVIAQVEKQWQLTSYAVGIRSGDMTRNGGSIEHLHAHIIVGDTEDPDHEPVRFKMSTRPKT